MAGVEILREALVSDTDVTAIVPPERIAAGVLPQGTMLPAIALARVSLVERNIPSPGPVKHVTERVQATIMAESYVQMDAVHRAVKRAAIDVAIDGPTGVSAIRIHSLGAGPDFMDEAATIHMTSHDFRVTYNEAR